MNHTHSQRQARSDRLTNSFVVRPYMTVQMNFQGIAANRKHHQFANYITFRRNDSGRNNHSSIQSRVPIYGNAIQTHGSE